MLQNEKHAPMDHTRLMQELDELVDRYPFLSVSYLGESILGRGIPLVTLGEGKKGVLYVGAHHGMEWITTTLLLRWIEELCKANQSNQQMFDLDMQWLLSTRTLYVLPMLNPDGVDYQIHGVSADNVLYERLLSMNGGTLDFSRWQANARGVDLNHNYNAGFVEYKRLEVEQNILSGAPTRYSGEMPESEPEVGQLCNFIRYHAELKMVMTFHTQGEEIYYTSGEQTTPFSYRIAKALSRMSGYHLRIPQGNAAYGGLTDWCIEALNLPAFTIECGKGENPLPVTDVFSIYTKIRKMLFLAPTLI